MRREQDSPLIQAMIANRDRYNAEIVTLGVDQSNVPASTQLGPNFFIEGIDGIARIANQDLPKISCPAVNPGEPKSQEKAAMRQGALYGAWNESQLEMKTARAFRHYAGYGTFAMNVMPDTVRGTASIEVRDPLTAYPELRSADDIRSPNNVGFMYARSAEWIVAHYPAAKQSGFLGQDSLNKGWETLWDVVEWIDEDVIVIGLLGPRFPANGYYDSRPIGYTAVELDRWDNRAGMVPVVVPRRVTLDKVMGQMTNMINYSDTYGRLMQLQLSATEKAVFPDIVLESRTGGTPTITGGVWKDGRTGDVNTVIDGTVQIIGKEAGPGTVPMLQLIDGHIRGSGGASGILSGSAGAMRSGAGVDALGDYGPNPIVAEAQKAMGYALEELNKGVIAVQKGYFGQKKFTVYLGVLGSAKAITYKPDDIDSDMNSVKYPHPGLDQNRYAVVVSQLNATKMISRKTARRMNPLVADEDEEEMFTAQEEIDDALLGGVAQQLASGQMPMSVGARIAQKIGEGITPSEAVLQAQAEAATAQPAPGADGGPPPVGPPGSPQAGQPIPAGLAAMLAGSGAGPGAAPGQGVPGPPPGMTNLRHVLQGENENISPGAV